MPPVVFSFATWTAMFGEFAALTPDQGQAYFNLACLYCANSATNPVNCDGNLATLLYMLTSHIASLLCPKDANGNPAATGAAASSLVGRISSAAEGSVNVSTELPEQGNSSALESFLQQTKYGLAYLAAIAQYRTAVYLPMPTLVINSAYPGFGWRN